MKTRRLLAVSTVLAVCGALALPSMASDRARSGVTIHHRGHHFYGYVFSTKPHRCARLRKVRLFKQDGKTQDQSFNIGRTDSAATSQGNGQYRWRVLVEDSGLNRGRFFARIHRTAGCQEDSSRTTRVR